LLPTESLIALKATSDKVLASSPGLLPAIPPPNMLFLVGEETRILMRKLLLKWSWQSLATWQKINFRWRKGSDEN